MKKIIYNVYLNNDKIASFEKKEYAKLYIKYLDFYNTNIEDKYYYRKEYIYV